MHIVNGMDGVVGLTQPGIPPGRTFVYEFDLPRSGTFMYHPHADEMMQMAMGMMGFFGDRRGLGAAAHRARGDERRAAEDAAA